MQSRVKQRGRQSIANITTPRPIEVQPRQPLPPELSGEEAEEYLRIINSEEAAWFTPSCVPLLVQYVRHIQARRVAELLEKHAGRSHTSIDLYSDLLKQQRAESNSLSQLATKLRLSPQSMRNNRGNPRIIVGSGSRPVPWQETE